MLLKLAAAEFQRQVRRASVWVPGALLLLLGVLSVIMEQAQMGGYRDTHQNSPYAIADRILVGSFLLVLMNATMADASVRHRPECASPGATGEAQVIGSFLGILAVSSIVLATIPLGIWIGTLVPGVSPERLGANRAVAYFAPYVILGLPNLLLSSTFFLAAASFERSRLGILLALLAFVAMWAASLTLRQSGGAGELLEPFGATAYFAATAGWTAAERNSIVFGAFEALIANRILWLAASAALLFLAWRRNQKRAATP